MKRVFLLALCLAGCHAAVPTVTPGQLTVRLTTGGSNDGAIVFVVSGGAVASVQAVGSYEVTSFTDGAGVHVMVVGDIAAGALVHVQVPDVSHASNYLAVINQVADRSNFGLVDASNYRVTVDEFP